MRLLEMHGIKQAWIMAAQPVKTILESEKEWA
jgi:hypothetical protein